MSDSPITQAVAPAAAPALSGPDGHTEVEEKRSPTSKLVLAPVLVLVVVGIALLIASFDTTRHWFALHTGIIHGGPDQY
jgi:hypothetical protein